MRFPVSTTLPYKDKTSSKLSYDQNQVYENMTNWSSLTILIFRENRVKNIKISLKVFFDPVLVLLALPTVQCHTNDWLIYSVICHQMNVSSQPFNLQQKIALNNSLLTHKTLSSCSKQPKIMFHQSGTLHQQAFVYLPQVLHYTTVLKAVHSEKKEEKKKGLAQNLQLWLPEFYHKTVATI